jgi:hypothetical protein
VRKRRNEEETGAAALADWKDLLCTAKGEPRGTRDNETPVLPDEAERLWAAGLFASEKECGGPSWLAPVEAGKFMDALVENRYKAIGCCMFGGRTTVSAVGCDFTQSVVNHCLRRGFSFADGMFAAITLRENGIDRRTPLGSDTDYPTEVDDLIRIWDGYCTKNKIRSDFMKMCRICADGGLKLPLKSPPIVDDLLALDCLWRTVGNATSVAPVSAAAMIPGLYSAKMKLEDPARMAKSAMAQARRVAYLAWEKHGIVPPPGYCRQSLLRSLSRARTISRIDGADKMAAHVVQAVRQMSACIGSGNAIDDIIRRTACGELDRYHTMFGCSLSLIVACRGSLDYLKEIAEIPVGEDVPIDMPDVSDLALFAEAENSAPIGIDDDQTGCSAADEPEGPMDLFDMIEKEEQVSSASVWG